MLPHEYYTSATTTCTVHNRLGDGRFLHEQLVESSPVAVLVERTVERSWCLVLGKSRGRLLIRVHVWRVVERDAGGYLPALWSPLLVHMVGPPESDADAQIVEREPALLVGHGLPLVDDPAEAKREEHLSALATGRRPPGRSWPGSMMIIRGETRPMLPDRVRDCGDPECLADGPVRED